MATENKNLSNYDKATTPTAAGFNIGIAVSEWNDQITKGLLQGCVDTLIDLGANENDINIQWVPGTYELPLVGQQLLEQGKCDGVVCIGSVIQGETRHFDFVCEAASQGIKDVGLKTGKPAIFCVLTDNNMQQSIDRSGGKHGNKGIEAAVALVKMLDLQKRISKRIF